jgi:hypothetical protein
MKNNIKIKRLPGKSTACTVRLELAFDAADPAALERFGRILREVIPEGERAQFLEDWQRAAAAAGLKMTP